MFTQPFIDFLNSDDKEIIYKQENNVDYCVYKRKINDNISMLYDVEFDNTNLYRNQSLEPVCVVNNKTNEILHVLNSYFFNYELSKTDLFKGDINDVINQVKNKKNQFEEEVKKAVFDKFESEKDKLIEELTPEEIEECKSEVLDLLINSNEPKDIRLSTDINNNIKFIESLFFNYENLKDRYIQKLYDDYKEDYKMYLGIKREYEKSMSNLETNDNEKFKSKVLEIFNSRKYKNIKIIYTHPNGDEELVEYGKEMDRYGFEQVKRDILAHEKINDIPILAIKSIKWSRSVLLNADDYNIDYKQSEKEKDFIKLDNIGHFPEHFYKDPDFIFEAIKTNEYNVKYLTENLKNDKEFCQKILDVAPFRMVYPSFGDDIKKDVDFVIKNFPKNISKYNRCDMLNLLPGELFADMKFIKFLKEQEFDLEFVSGKMREVDILSKEFKEVLGDYKLHNIYNSNILLYDFEQIEEVFSEDAIARNFNDVDYTTLPKETILKYVLNRNFSEDSLYKNDVRQSILSYFAENNEMICEFARKIYRNPVKFLSELHINPTYDNDSVLMFCSYSPLFICLLNKENKELFINSAIDDIEDIYIEDGSIIFSNDYFNIEMRDYWNNARISINNKEGTISKNITDLKLMETDEFAKLLFEKIEEKFDKKVNTVSEALTVVEEATETHEKNEEIEEEIDLPF